MGEIVFKRKAYEEMLDWKSRLADRYALLIEGARRVGKTTLIDSFTKSEYKSRIYIDFSQKSGLTKASIRAFEQEPDVPSLLERLALLHDVTLVEGGSCIVFDEVQRYPAAREMIKHLVRHGKYHYIESGSLVGIKENVKDIVIPSEEHGMKMHPLDFEEFMWALGAEPLARHIRKQFAARMPLGKDLHEKAMRLFRQYMLVGGMPQAVAGYVQGGERRLEAAEEAKREILALYLSDIGKYARGYAAKVRAIFRHIPAALNRREKRFRLSDLNVNARTRRYENAFLWLADAMVANIAYNATNPSVGLEMSLESTFMKCYSLDTGLLVTQAMSGTKAVDGRILRGVLYDNLGINEGMFFENAVAQSLVARGYDLLFYSRRDPKDRGATMEIDFLIRNGIKICPVEVKSSRAGAHASLDRFIAAYGRMLGERFVVCGHDRSEHDGITYLPVYMVHCI